MLNPALSTELLSQGILKTRSGRYQHLVQMYSVTCGQITQAGIDNDIVVQSRSFFPYCISR